MNELFEFGVVEKEKQRRESEPLKWIKAMRRKQYVDNLNRLNEQVVRVVLSDNGISYFCQVPFDVAPFFSLLDSVSTVCAPKKLEFYNRNRSGKANTTSMLAYPRQTRLRTCFRTTHRGEWPMADLFTNFERDIPLSMSYCAIRKDSIIGRETAKSLYDAGVDVRCDAFLWPPSEQQRLFPDLDLRQQMLEVHFTRDNLVNCGWVFLPDLAFDRKSLMRRLNQFFLLLLPLALPVYVVEMIFNHLMTLNLFARLSTKYNVDDVKWEPSDSLYAIVLEEFEKRFHYQKIDALTRMTACAKNIRN